MKKLLLLTFLFISSFVFSQKQQYSVVTLSGTTYVTKDYSSNNKEITFKTEEGKTLSIPFKQLDKIISSGKKEKHNYTDKYIMYSKSKGDLMRELVDGNCSLYLRSTTSMNGVGAMGIPTTTTSNEFYVIKKGQKTAKYLKGNNLAYGAFKKNVQKFFSDCEVLLKKIDEREFKRKDVQEIVVFYNENCKN